MKVKFLKPEYVNQLPDQMEEGSFYICKDFDLTAHKCCCGCGEDVFNKLGPAKWSLSEHHDGSVSLNPSIGNWKYACKSHYWITKNRVTDAGPMSDAKIAAVIMQDRKDSIEQIERFNSANKVSTVSDRIKSLTSSALKWVKDLFR